MKIQIITTVTTEKEISFPFITYDPFLNTYYYNYKEKGCIMISPNGVELRSCNFGFEYPEAKKEEAFRLMDSTILMITEALNK